MDDRKYIHKMMPLARDRGMGVFRVIDLIGCFCRQRQLIRALKFLPNRKGGSVHG